MIKPPLATSIVSLLGVAISASPLNSALAGDNPRQTSYSTDSAISQRELVRRHESTVAGEEAIKAGQTAMRDNDYQKAFDSYRSACDQIPNSKETAHLYSIALRGLEDAGIALARQRITEGEYTQAEGVLKTVLHDYNPNCKKAMEVLANLESPDYYHKTITPGFRAQVEQVKQYFVDAKGFLDSGRYLLAYKRCEQILTIDPYNIAALKLEEEINRKKDDFAVEGYNNTRAYMLWQLDKRWSHAVRHYDVNRISTQVSETTLSRIEINQHKLDSIIIPKIDFHDATIREAITFLKQKSIELDPDHAGVNIVLSIEGGTGEASAPAAVVAPAIPGIDNGAAPAPAPIVAAGSPANTPITVSLTNIPLGEALRYVTNLANLKFKVEEYAIRVVPLSVSTEQLITRDWKVPPGMFQAKTDTSGSALEGGPTPAGGRGGGAATTATGPLVKNLQDAKESLSAQGVPFPPNATATYLPSSSELIVKNTPDAMDLIEAIVEGYNSVAAQVEIEAKFVEVQQNNFKELSFDWLLGQANVPGTNNRAFYSGGTTGTATGVDQNQFPFSVGQGANQTFPVTSSLRSGSLAISQNAIDALLMGTSGVAGPSPATAAIAGVFSDPTFQVVIHALNQKQGVDLLSAPRVTTKSGQRAVIEVIREFRYPTEFEPPQIPQTFGNNTGGNFVISATANPVNQSSQGSFPVTPTTPTAFEVRNTGVTLEVEPVIGPDNVTIDLNLVPQVVEFEGFINYGSPIQTTSTNLLGQTITNIITPNVINQPIFSTRKVTTSISIYDGQTVVLGGLMREDVQKVQDKIPGIGDIPLFGRLFRSDVEQHLKTNLVMFVTARLINTSGDAIHSEEEQEEVVTTLPTPEVTEPPLMVK